jgi:hypothetical protein
MVLINSDFHTRNNLSENIPQYGRAPSELFASPIFGRKSLKNVSLKGRRIINLPGSPRLGPALVVRHRLVFVHRGFRTAKEEILDPWNVGRMSCFTIPTNNQLPTYDAQRPRRKTSDIACLLQNAWIAVIFDNLSAVQVAKKFPIFFQNSPLLAALLTHESNPFPYNLFI